jgi:hypothetical protein
MAVGFVTWSFMLLEIPKGPDIPHIFQNISQYPFTIPIADPPHHPYFSLTGLYPPGDLYRMGSTEYGRSLTEQWEWGSSSSLKNRETETRSL